MITATFVGGPRDGEDVSFSGTAFVQPVELPHPSLAELDEMFGDHPLWVYVSEFDPDRHRAFWSQYQDKVVLAPERDGERWVLRWPEEGDGANLPHP